jgi:hypothetical protein
MNHKLSIDEFDALTQVSKLAKNTKPSACVARNTKRLSGIKYITHRKDGSLELTEVGQQVLFIKQCIDGLQAIANNSSTELTSAVTSFLEKKGHIVANPATGNFEISEKGRECLQDIVDNQKQ